jgi:hypothetical protein
MIELLLAGAALMISSLGIVGRLVKVRDQRLRRSYLTVGTLPEP